MHYHKCVEPTANGQVCGQITGAADGITCEDCMKPNHCSLHHPDPQFKVEPTPPLTRNPAPESAPKWGAKKK